MGKDLNVRIFNKLENEEPSKEFKFFHSIQKLNAFFFVLLRKIKM